MALLIYKRKNMEKKLNLLCIVVELTETITKSDRAQGTSVIAVFVRKV